MDIAIHVIMNVQAVVHILVEEAATLSVFTVVGQIITLGNIML